MRRAACLAGRLSGGKQQGDEDGDDRDHHQKFDQCESALPISSHVISPMPTKIPK